MDKIDIAFEELKMLQDIIARHDELSFQIKGWCMTLNVGVIAAIYGIGGGSTINASKVLVFIALVLITIFFIWLEAIYRVAMNRAIQRTATIEKEIREDSLGEYPKINLTLGIPNKIKDQIKALENIRIVAPYFIIFLIDSLALLIKN